MMRAPRFANAQIFSAQGKAINEAASRDIRVLVVGNPANTNALIAASNAPDIERRNFTAMMRLDHNRSLAQLAEKTGTHTTAIRRMIVWGNHSATQYPDISHCTIGGKPAHSLVSNQWYREQFIPIIQQRGAAISKAVPADGNYAIPEGVMYSYPVTCAGGRYAIVQGLAVDEFSRDRMDATH